MRIAPDEGPALLSASAVQALVIARPGVLQLPRLTPHPNPRLSIAVMGLSVSTATMKLTETSQHLLPLTPQR